MMALSLSRARCIDLVRIQIDLRTGNSTSKFFSAVGREAQGERMREVFSVVVRLIHEAFACGLCLPPIFNPLSSPFAVRSTGITDAMDVLSKSV